MEEFIIDQIKQHDTKLAVIYNDIEYNYNQLFLQIDLYYNIIKLQIRSGQTVSILSDYSFYSVALFFALYKNKNIIVPITSKIETEVKERLNIVNCNYSILIENDVIKIEKLEEKNCNELIERLIVENCSGLILFSSGSTGKPKAMIHNLDNFINSFKDKKSKNLVFLIFLMFDHIGGLNSLLNCISMGVTMVFPQTRNPEEICKLIEKYQINILPASPTFLNLILISESYLKYDLSSLRLITYGTEPMPDSLLIKLKNEFTKVKFLQTFGTSETGISNTVSKSSDSTLIKIDDPNIQYKIVENELWLKSNTQILGYLNSSMDRFTEDGWFKTGDIVESLESGFLKIIGRNNDIINVGGEKVFPTEVESVILQMTDIEDCIVYGEPNPIIGQMVVVKVKFKNDINSIDAKKIILSFCKDKIERFKIPTKVIIMNDIEFSSRFKKKRI